MADPIFERDEVVTAFRYASHWWRSLVGAVGDDAWSQPGLGEWTVLELVAHTNRAYRTLVEYVEGGAKDPNVIETAPEYFRIVLAEETPHVHIAARGHQEAEGYRGQDPVVVTEGLAAQAVKLVEAAPGDTVMHLFVGEMVLSQYLATRVVELVVHGLDLAVAIDLPTEPPAEAAAVALAVLAALARPSDVSALLRLLTGRAPSVELANVLG